MNLAAFLAKSARQHSTREAIRWGATSMSYQTFYDRALSVGGELRSRGLHVGDRVAIATTNRPEILETMFGCFAAGLIAVPMNARLHPKEMAYIVDHAGAAAMIHSEELRQGIEETLSDFGDLRHRFVLASIHRGGDAKCRIGQVSRDWNIFGGVLVDQLSGGRIVSPAR